MFFVCVGFFAQVHQPGGEPCCGYHVGGRGLAQLPPRVPMGLQGGGIGQLQVQLHHSVHRPVHKSRVGVRLENRIARVRVQTGLAYRPDQVRG